MKNEKQSDERVILYYKFVPLKDPQATMLWQRELCARLGLKGRIIVSQHGINGTLGGKLESLRKYRRAMTDSMLFGRIQYKWTKGGASDFPRLSVKVRDELVTLAPGEEFDVFNSTKGLSPKEWHEYIEKNPDVIILDARNDYESDVGAFKGKNVIKPKIGAFREIKKELDKIPKNKKVLTYCTGDIRCEYLSAYMSHKGFEDVNHLEGGIIKYGQEYGDDGFWEGKCFTFDERMVLGFSEDSQDIANCTYCDTKTSRFINCANKECNKLILVCDACSDSVVCGRKQCSVKAAQYA